MRSPHTFFTALSSDEVRGRLHTLVNEACSADEDECLVELSPTSADRILRVTDGGPLIRYSFEWDETSLGSSVEVRAHDPEGGSWFQRWFARRLLSKGWDQICLEIEGDLDPDRPAGGWTQRPTSRPIRSKPALRKATKPPFAIEAPGVREMLATRRRWTAILGAISIVSVAFWLGSHIFYNNVLDDLRRDGIRTTATVTKIVDEDGSYDAAFEIRGSRHTLEVDVPYIERKKGSRFRILASPDGQVIEVSGEDLVGYPSDVQIMFAIAAVVAIASTISLSRRTRRVTRALEAHPFVLVSITSSAQIDPTRCFVRMSTANGPSTVRVNPLTIKPTFAWSMDDDDDDDDDGEVMVTAGLPDVAIVGMTQTGRLVTITRTRFATRRQWWELQVKVDNGESPPLGRRLMNRYFGSQSISPRK